MLVSCVFVCVLYAHWCECECACGVTHLQHMLLNATVRTMNTEDSTNTNAFLIINRQNSSGRGKERSVYYLSTNISSSTIFHLLLFSSLST